MTTAQPLSSIERVELREIWPNEAQDFTPWLAENITELGAALGLELELQQREAAVGGYSLDILATDLNSNRPVIIENQLESTDHDHLGKLLTYAAGFDASVVVWLTREFRDEHRQTLDWLNQRTSEETSFFGVVIELWRIDNSKPAPHFRMVATPNEWRKETVSMSTGQQSRDVSERRERYRTFFQRLLDTLREQHRFTGARKGQPQNWYNFASGNSQFTYGANFTSERQARVEVYIDSGDGKNNVQLFERLHQHKSDIESSLGHPLDWQELEGRRACRIATTRAGTIFDDDDTLSDIHDWMVGRLLKFKEVFDPYLRELGG